VVGHQGRALPGALIPARPGDKRARVAAREPGSGRPTKRDRRAIDRLLDDDDE